MRDRLFHADIHAQASKRLLGMARQRLWKARQQAWSGLDQQHVRLLRSNSPEVGRERLARKFDNGAGHLDPGRPAADNYNARARALHVVAAVEHGRAHRAIDALNSPA